jgi:dihydroxyacetone kinase
LIGAWLLALGGGLPEPDTDAAVDAIPLSHALEAALAAVQRLGGARRGDKTLVDTLGPFTTAFEAAAIGGSPIGAAWDAALAAAAEGMIATTGMVSKRGRSSRLGERSRGHQDPGATSMYAILQALKTAFV